MTNITVTGGSGHTGHAVVRSLIESGHHVQVVDIIPPEDRQTPYTICDLQNFGEAVDSLKDTDVIVHLAAIPRPTFFPSHTVFQTNVISTYNVFEAASILGIQKVIYASSISVTGYPFYYRFFEPQYIPIDEKHPAAPQDPYGLSKYIGEEIAKAFVRRSDMAVISLRMPWIHTPQTFLDEVAPHRNDPAFGASNLWLYVDSRDISQAVQLSINADLQGHNEFYISALDSFMETPSTDLVQSFYPNTAIKPGFGGTQSLINCQKAMKILNYNPEYSWMSYY